MAGAGFGTSGEVFEFGVKENNYLGKGIGLDADLTLGSDKIEGNFNVISLPHCGERSFPLGMLSTMMSHSLLKTDFTVL